MNVFLWILQGFLALTFGYSGIMKATQSRERLVSIGQTGVAQLSYPLIRFIGVTELLGVAGILLPWWFQILPVLTPITAVCFAAVMVLAAPIHYKRNEGKAVGFNVVLFFLCAFVAWMRFSQL